MVSRASGGTRRSGGRLGTGDTVPTAVGASFRGSAAHSAATLLRKMVDFDRVALWFIQQNSLAGGLWQHGRHKATSDGPAITGGSPSGDAL